MITLRNIQKSFDSLQVLRGIDLDISKGEIVSIVGPSGAGKTTLLQIMGTLEKPDNGIVSYDDINPLTLQSSDLAHWRNRNIGFVFQFHQLLPEFSVEENVAMPALIGKDPRSKAFERARNLLDYMGLSHRLDHRPAQLSGGERQRAAVARALVNNPKVILADEPSGSLDSHNRNELHQLFFNLRRDMGSTFVIVTHDEQLANQCDRVIHLCDGQVSHIHSTNNISQ